MGLHRRAISGYIFMVDRGAVSWSSKKQELVTLSTAEAEYIAQTHTAKEAIWLRRLLTKSSSQLTPQQFYSVTATHCISQQWTLSCSYKAH